MSDLTKLLIDGRRVVFGPTELAIFAALYNSRGGYHSISAMISVCYGNREDGGPELAACAISQAVMSVRTKLVGTNFAIVTGWTRGYQLVRARNANDKHLQRLSANQGHCRS